MSALRQLYLFLTKSRTSYDLFSWGFLFQIRAIFYGIVIMYTVWISFLFPDIINEFQPIKLQQFVFGEHILSVFLLVVLLWPLMEELLFRAGMRRWWWNVSWLLWAFFFIVVKYLLHDYVESLHIESQFILSCIGYGLYLVCVFCSFHLSKPFFPRISRIYAKFPMIIFRLLTFAFGLVHLSNYNTSEWWYKLILLIVPQIILWVMLWFVRMKWGLWFAIVLHMFHNAIQLIPLLIMKQMSWVNNILTYTPNLKAEDLFANPWMLINSMYMSLLFWFVLRNIVKELQYLYYWDIPLGLDKQ